MPSPVQPGPKQPWLVFAVAIVAALAAWTVQQDWRMSSFADPPATRASPPPQDADSTRGTTTNIASIFTPDDYPQDALSKGEQGSVIIEYSVDLQGAVDSCIVRKGSGSDALDRATCAIVLQRARFDPPRDENGNPTRRTATQTIRWQLEDE